MRGLALCLLLTIALVTANPKAEEPEEHDSVISSLKDILGESVADSSDDDGDLGESDDFGGADAKPARTKVKLQVSSCSFSLFFSLLLVFSDSR